MRKAVLQLLLQGTRLSLLNQRTGSKLGKMMFFCFWYEYYSVSFSAD